jgi:lipoprotein NlpI
VYQKKKVINKVHEKGSRNNPLSDEQKTNNKEKSTIRVRVEHILIQASQFSPENERIYYNVAMLYDFLGDKELAERYLRKCIEIAPDMLDGYNSLLEFYTNNNKPPAATELTDEMRKKFP